MWQGKISQDLARYEKGKIKQDLVTYDKVRIGKIWQDMTR